MNPIRIDIPNQDMRRAAGQIVIDALREAGIDPLAAAKHAMVKQLVAEWGKGDLSREEFIRMCRNLVIMCPSLKGRP